MTLFHAALLGVLQGLTEFLPISSSGHLYLAELFFGLPFSARDLQAFDIVLHAGSLFAVFFCYFRTWRTLAAGLLLGERRAWKLFSLLLLATIPAAVIGGLFENVIAETFRSTLSVGISLGIAGVILILSEQVIRPGTIAHLSPLQAIVVGIAQSFAFIRGLSRSAMSISAGRAVGLSRTESVDFSFLLAFPITAGAVALTAVHVFRGDVLLPALPITLAGFFSSLVVSVLAISFLRYWVRRRSLAWFALYLIPLSIFLVSREAHLVFFLEPGVLMEAVHRYGPIAVFVLSIIETTPPISFFSPGILVLVLLGAVVNSWPMIGIFVFASFLGTAFANTVLYVLGQYFGERIADRIGLRAQTLRTAHSLAERFGVIGIILGQFTGTIRPFMAFAAGAAAMSPRRFYPSMCIGSLAFGTTYLMIGALLGPSAGAGASVLGIGGLFIPVVIFLGYWWMNERR